jgi:hypothetical protein
MKMKTYKMRKKTKSPVKKTGNENRTSKAVLG